MPCRATVDGGAPATQILSDVWGDAPLPQIGDEVAGVVCPVGRQRDPARFRALDIVEHRDRGQPFGKARHPRGLSIDRQPVAVLHQDVPHVAQPGAGTWALAIQARVRIGGRGMGIVAAPGAAKIDFAIATALTVGWLIGLDLRLGTKALHAAPCLDQRAIHREMLGRQQALHLRPRQDRGQESAPRSRRLATARV